MKRIIVAALGDLPTESGQVKDGKMGTTDYRDDERPERQTGLVPRQSRYEHDAHSANQKPKVKLCNIPANHANHAIDYRPMTARNRGETVPVLLTRRLHNHANALRQEP
jgi:hypothetical protein